MLTYELEILCYIVHFLSFKIGYDDVDLIAARVVHASQEHKFRQLRKVGWIQMSDMVSFPTMSA